MFRILAALGLIILSACSTTSRFPPSDIRVSSAVVTGVSSGRMSRPGEKMYGVRVPSGRVYFVTQSLTTPLKEGDTVEIELGDGGKARIRER